MAYSWLLAAALTGFPVWPYYKATGSISVDGAVWSFLNLLVHGNNILHLLMDERPISFKTDDDEQLYRFFYRRGGMGKTEMYEVWKRGKWTRIAAGNAVLEGNRSVDTLMLLVEGKARFTRKTGGILHKSAPLFSGMAFDINLFNVFGIYVAFEKEDTVFEVVAETDCLVFQWDINKLDEIACKTGPATSSYFRNFILCQMALEWEYRIDGIAEGCPPRSCRGFHESPELLEGHRSCDFTDPLDAEEKSKFGFKQFFQWIWYSLAMHTPPGIRHKALPTSGLSGRRRILALQQSKHKAETHLET